MLNPATGLGFNATNRTRSYDCPGCLATRNNEHLGWCSLHAVVSAQYVDPDEAQHLRKKATKKQLAFATFTYEHLSSALVVGQVPAIPNGTECTAIEIVRNSCMVGVDYRQKRYTHNKYAKLAKEKLGYIPFIYPAWATAQDRHYVLTALGFHVSDETVEMPDWEPTQGWGEVIGLAFKAYNSGELDDYVDELRNPRRNGGKWAWE